jgi:Lectin C-type domain
MWALLVSKTRRYFFKNSNVYFKTDSGNERIKYYVSKTLTKNWYGASKYCKELGMTPVAFSTKEEAVYFNSIAGDNIWVGINDIMKDGYLVQEGGVKVPEMPWANGAPNNVNLNKNCIQSEFIGAFNNKNCNDQLKFGCKTIETIANNATSTVAPSGTINDPVVNTFFKDIGFFGE